MNSFIRKLIESYFSNIKNGFRFQYRFKANRSYYLDNYKPFDKAGAYGIQEWIGLVGINRIDGSYTNVVGLPTEKVYHYLSNRD